ncbi:hypothetical protein VSDG_01151 [Cytospora chrysosperma]|uniref:Uncharacterized protein n=1 Tax=Cytospora chrysosperma TaxID=252740 RepID=A0A423WLQ9_CYTCH|nr:hypothetical protein VSDG_01151 [Valsa sordida]
MDIRSDSPPHPPCSIVTWGDTTAEDDGAHKQNPGDCNRRPLATTDDLRNEIASLAAQRDVPPVTATISQSFVTTAGSEQQQQQQQPPHARRKPLIIIHGLPEPFLSALLESPLDIDPAFIEAHARGRRYRPRGRAQARRRGGRASHWDYPELVGGCRQAPKQHKQRQQQAAWAARSVGGVGGGDVAAVFCRASLWGAEGVDVLFLDDHDGSVCRRSPGSSSTLRQARGRSDATSAGCTLVGREGTSRGEAGGRWQVVPPEKGEGMASPGGILRDIIGAGDIDGGTLEDVLEEAAYDRWLEFFEVLTPRRRAIVPDRPSLEWTVMQALERNTDMGKEIARWRRRDNHNLGYPDWEGLMRRLQMRVEMLTTMSPRLNRPTARPSRNIPIHESNLGLLPRPRQPVLTDTDGDPSSAANDNQHALDRVTYLGGILLPFSIVSGVLSMNEDFGPGHALFWVFWVIAVPLAVLVLLVIYADKLRRVEEYVWDPVKGGDPDEGGRPVAKKKAFGIWPGSGPKVSIPGGRRYFARSQAVVTHGEDGEVAIDLGTPSTAAGTQADPAWPHPRPSPGSSTPDDGQAHSEQQTDDEEEDYSADGDLDDTIYVTSLPMHIQPNTIPSPAVASPERIIDDFHHHRRRRRHQGLRTQQLGWAGAVQCMLHLRKPSLVSDGVPAGAPGGPRRWLETR